MNTYLGNERKLRILLVDDEEDLLQLMRLTLRADGHQVFICRNGENIETLIEENKPDLILLDIRMDQVDGGEICQLLKRNPAMKHIKIVLFSGNDNLLEIKERCGADGALAKPYDKEVAIKTFAEVMG